MSFGKKKYLAQRETIMNIEQGITNNEGKTA
jgi:hypothetical protein